MTDPVAGLPAVEPVAFPFRGAEIAAMRWPGDPGRGVLLLHPPGADLDAWGDLPALLARDAGATVLAPDLPGHGMSGDTTSPWTAGDLLAASLAECPARTVAVLAGEAALDALLAEPPANLAGLVLIDPDAPSADGPDPAHTPRLPKLLLVPSPDPERIRALRAIATRAGGWAIVSRIAATEDDTLLLDGQWGVHVREQVVAFARDCLYRR